MNKKVFRAPARRKQTEMFEVTLENELDKSVEILANNRRAKKSGPGRSWNKSSRSFCGVLDCSNCTYSCPDLWFFRLPLHSIEAKRYVL